MTTHPTNNCYQVKDLKDCYTLYNQVQIPCIGYGTYKTPNDEIGLQCIVNALKAGYRHIDTAQGYQNEHLISDALNICNMDRKDIFITSKLWNDNQGYQKTLDSFEQTCKNLGTSYLDLFLIHWPIPVGHDDDWKQLNKETWKALEELYLQKRVRAIGVSNFLIHHLDNLLESATIKPMVNQLEIHPKYQQREIVQYCQDYDILIESWGPLMRGKAFKEPAFLDLSNKLNKSVAQILLRWCLQKNILPLQKTTKFERMIENAKIFDFILDEQTMQFLDSMNTDDCYVFHPDRNYEWKNVKTD